MKVGSNAESFEWGFSHWTIFSIFLMIWNKFSYCLFDVELLNIRSCVQHLRTTEMHLKYQANAEIVWIQNREGSISNVEPFGKREFGFNREKNQHLQLTSGNYFWDRIMVKYHWLITFRNFKNIGIVKQRGSGKLWSTRKLNKLCDNTYEDSPCNLEYFHCIISILFILRNANKNLRILVSVLI